MWLIFLAILGVIVFVVFRNSKVENTQANNKFRQSYSCEEGKFLANGEKDNFIISKNDNFEFLVKDGQIVACKDKRSDEKFVYYGGGK